MLVQVPHQHCGVPDLGDHAIVPAHLALDNIYSTTNNPPVPVGPLLHCVQQEGVLGHVGADHPHHLPDVVGVRGPRHEVSSVLLQRLHMVSTVRYLHQHTTPPLSKYLT